MNKLIVIASAFVALTVLPGCPQRANVRVDNPSVGAPNNDDAADRERREREDDRQEERR